MNSHVQHAATIRIISHNANRSSMAVTALLNSACKTADIILIQEVNITDPHYEVTHPNFLLVKPPKGQRRSNRTAAYISRSNPFLQVTQCTDVCNDPDLQVLEVSTPLIPSFLLLNIYNQHHSESCTYTIPRALTPLTLPPRCIITGDLNAHHAHGNGDPPLRSPQPPPKSSIFPSNSDSPYSITYLCKFSERYR
jgi:hypothetical protein